MSDKNDRSSNIDRGEWNARINTNFIFIKFPPQEENVADYNSGLFYLLQFFKKIYFSAVLSDKDKKKIYNSHTRLSLRKITNFIE